MTTGSRARPVNGFEIPDKYWIQKPGLQGAVMQNVVPAGSPAKQCTSANLTILSLDTHQTGCPEVNESNCGLICRVDLRFNYLEARLCHEGQQIDIQTLGCTISDNDTFDKPLPCALSVHSFVP